jgi:hypothetical protein
MNGSVWNHTYLPGSPKEAVPTPIIGLTRKRHALVRSYRITLARPSRVLRSLEDGCQPLLALAEGWGVGSHTQSSPEPRRPGRRARLECPLPRYATIVDPMCRFLAEELEELQRLVANPMVEQEGNRVAQDLPKQPGAQVPEVLGPYPLYGETLGELGENGIYPVAESAQEGAPLRGRISLPGGEGARNSTRIVPRSSSLVLGEW